MPRSVPLSRPVARSSSRPLKTVRHPHLLSMERLQRLKSMNSGPNHVANRECLFDLFEGADARRDRGILRDRRRQMRTNRLPGGLDVAFSGTCTKGWRESRTRVKSRLTLLRRMLIERRTAMPSVGCAHDRACRRRGGARAGRGTPTHPRPLQSNRLPSLSSDAFQHAQEGLRARLRPSGSLKNLCRLRASYAAAPEQPGAAMRRSHPPAWLRTHTPPTDLHTEADLLSGHQVPCNPRYPDTLCNFT